jgi:uncharacterized repeat protein (TIGR01451 family)
MRDRPPPVAALQDIVKPMRVPSGRGTRGWSARGCFFALLTLVSFGASDLHAQAITRFARDTGNINFVTTGGSLRNSPNTGSPCAVNTTSSQQLSGIPVGRTVRNAYLYWGGSGNTADTTVTLNGNNVTASRTFARTFNNGTVFNFFGGFADVTNIVAPLGNGNYTFGGLTVSTGSPWCASQAVVGGWSLIVIYQGTGERLRAINLYDGLDYFYGSQVTLTPDGFRVPAANIDGRVAVFTLEGDPQNSDPSGGFSESLRFNGSALDDGLVPTGSDPTFQQFDGTINTQGVVTSYGIDVDQYEVGSLLSTGQTSATTVYSAGADLVLLMAQVVSATSDPAVNLGITVGHTGNFVAGQTGQYTINVSNALGFEREDNTVSVSTTLPTGLTFNAGSGTGWNCSAAGQVVTCTHAPTLNAGASFPALALTVNVLETAAPTVNLTATVSSPSFDSAPANNTATDPTSIVFPNLSTSTKTVQDLNGGEADPGDTLRYTITLLETAGYPTAGVTVTDHIPANTAFSGFVSIPPGATSNFSPPPNGDNDLGVITVSSINVAANGSATVVFDVVVANVSPGANIDNVAAVNNPNGPDASPAAPTVPVSPSQVPSSGTKQLYLWSNSQRLTRTRPTGTHNAISINGNNQSQTFTLNPALQTALTLNPGNFTVNLLLARTGNTNNTSRTVTVRLTNSALGNIASASQSFSSTSQIMYTFTLNTAGVTAPAGSTFALVVNNNSNNTSNRSVSLTPYNGSNYSRVDLNSATVIDVNSVTTWNAAFNGGAAQDTFAPGATVFVRALISDPFGSFDISSARITVLDPDNNVVVDNQLMSAQGAPATCNSTSAATCLFQYQLGLPPSAPTGHWTARVTGFEGVEGVQDIGVGTFEVAIPQPVLTVIKTSNVLTDPVNLAVNPRRIPGAVVRYDINVTNSGPGVVDAGTLALIDAIPANSSMYVLPAGNPVVFINGPTASGLTFNFGSHVTFSSAGPSGPWNYSPVPDANGFDPAVRAVRIVPGGSMNAAGSGNPSFTLQFRVRID